VAIDLLKSVQAIARGVPDRVRATYHPRSSGDSYGDAVVFDARRGPTRRELVDGLSRTVADWHLFATEQQTVVVKPLGKVVAPNGEVWHLGGDGSVERKFGDLYFVARGCVLEVS
jgi:hypothetical protein